MVSERCQIMSDGIRKVSDGAGVYSGEIVVGHLLELLDHAFGLLLCHDLAERLEVVDGLPQDLADGVLEDVYTAALPSEGVAAGVVIPQLIVFHLGHLDHSVGGVLGHAGVQGPPLCLVDGDNLPALQRKNVPEAVIIIRGVRWHPHNAHVIGHGVGSWGQVVVAVGLLHDPLSSTFFLFIQFYYLSSTLFHFHSLLSTSIHFH